MTLIEPDSTVVYEIAIGSHPLVVGEDDDRSDEELVAAVEERTEVADELDFPGWDVFVSDPPDMETLRYVDTVSRINVRAPYGVGSHKKKYDIFDAVADHLTIEDFPSDDWGMSCWSPTHEDDFDREIHLDMVGRIESHHKTEGQS